MNEQKLINVLLVISNTIIWSVLAAILCFIVMMAKVEANSINLIDNFIDNTLTYTKTDPFVTTSTKFTSFETYTIASKKYIVNNVYNARGDEILANELYFSVPTKYLTTSSVFVFVMYSVNAIPTTSRFAIYNNSDGSIVTDYEYCTPVSTINLNPPELEYSSKAPPQLIAISCSIPKYKDLSKYEDLKIGLYTSYTYVGHESGLVFHTFYQNKVTFTTTSNLQSVIEEVKEMGKDISDSINDVNDSINNSDVSGASNSASGFFNSFNSNSHGLSGIITSPLRLINSLSSGTCKSITLNIPYVKKSFSLTCFSSYYKQHFGGAFTLYQTIIFGLLAYKIIVNIFALVQGFKNPNDDKIEVVDL